MESEVKEDLERSGENGLGKFWKKRPWTGGLGKIGRERHLTRGLGKMLL
jgi:hypothetical protein